MKWIEPFLGGLFGIASVAASLIGTVYLLFYYLYIRSFNSIIEKAVPLFFLYLIVWTFLASLMIDHKIDIILAIKDSIKTIMIWIAVFFIGIKLYLPARCIGLVHMFFTIAVVACVIHAIENKNSFLGLYLTFTEDYSDGIVVATYQGIGRSITIMTILMVVLFKRLFIQTIILGGGLIILIGLGSRAHLFTIMLLLITNLILFGLKTRNLSTILASIFIFGVTVYYVFDFFLQTRAAEVFDLAKSTSWQARLMVNYEAFDVIRANPLIGNFGYHLGNSGGYAHNIFSAWTEYGLIGFLFFIGLMLYVLLLSIRHVVFHRKFSQLWLIAFQLNFVALFLALTSEPIMASVFPALGWGFTIQAIRSDQKDKMLLQKFTTQSSNMDKSEI